MTPGVSPEEEGTYFDPWSFQSQTCGQRRWLVTGPSIPRTPFALCHATREEFAFCFFFFGKGVGGHTTVPGARHRREKRATRGREGGVRRLTTEDGSIFPERQTATLFRSSTIASGSISAY